MRTRLMLKLAICLLLAVFFLQATPSYARFEFFDKTLAIDGYIQNQSSYRLSQSDGLVSVENRFVLDVDYKPFDFLSFFGSWRSIYDAIYDIRDEDTHFGKKYDQSKHELEWDNEFRQLYADVRAGDFSFRIGKQQIVWGESDGLRLMDIINPLDERRQFVTRDFADIRIGLWALKAIYNIETTSNFFFELVYIPEFKKNQVDLGSPTVYPRSYGPWSLPLPPASFAPGGIPLVPAITKENRDAWFDHNQQVGGRLAREIKGWFVTLNYFYGITQDPQLVFRGSTPVWIPPNAPPNPPNLVKLNLKQHFYHQHMAGFTFNKQFGTVVLRGEFATYIDEPVIQTNLAKEPDMVVRKTRQHMMVGFDYKAWLRFLNARQMISFSGQLFYTYTFGWSHTLAEGPYQQKLHPHWFAPTLKVNTEYLNGKIAPDLLMVYDINNRGLYIKPTVEFRIGSHWRPQIGALIFHGKDFTVPFGVMNSNVGKSEIFCRVKYQF